MLFYITLFKSIINLHPPHYIHSLPPPPRSIFRVGRREKKGGQLIINYSSIISYRSLHKSFYIYNMKTHRGHHPPKVVGDDQPPTTPFWGGWLVKIFIIFKTLLFSDKLN